ncbi:MAG TPA: type II and III secretion system protein [Bryobacteraceae bacterium]|nr:type II and III secretion system protein [Bryobacteraceae bacterium]
MKFLQTFAFLCLLSAACPAEDFAERLFKAGQRAEKAGDKMHAFLLYSQAAALDTTNPEFAMRKAMLQADAAMSVVSRVDEVPELESRSTASALRMSESEIAEAAARPPARLKPRDGVKNFDVTGDAKTVIETVLSEYGLTAVFEGGYQDPPKFRFRVEGVRFEEAMRTLEAVSNSFLIPVNQRIALIARDTPQKRIELSPAMSMAIPIPERISLQDAQEMTTAVVQMLEIRKFSLDPVKRMVYLRDQVPKVLAARAIFENLSRGRAQVEVEVEFLEVNKSSSLAYGLLLPTSAQLMESTGVFRNVTGAMANLVVWGGPVFLGVSIASSTLTATFAKSETHVLLKSQVTAADGQAATLHVGQKYPLVTATYSGGSTNSINASGASGLIAPPTVNFEDLGLVLKITPSVHEGGEVSLEIGAEFKVLGPTDANGNHSVSSRKYEGKVRLGGDELAVVTGLINATDGKTISGVFGLSSIPGIGRLLRLNNGNHSTDELLLLLRPRIVSLPPWEFESPVIWVGSDSKPLSVY